MTPTTTIPSAETGDRIELPGGCYFKRIGGEGQTSPCYTLHDANGCRQGTSTWGWKDACALAAALTAKAAAPGADEVQRYPSGEAVLGFEVAAYRETHPEYGDTYGHSYSEHWSTPNSRNLKVKVERLFTETQLREALARPAAPVVEQSDVELVQAYGKAVHEASCAVLRLDRDGPSYAAYEEREDEARDALLRRLAERRPAPEPAGMEERKTDQQIVAEVNDVARIMLRLIGSTGFVAPDDFQFHASENPRAKRAWQAAVEVYEQITDSEVHDALLAIEEDEDEDRTLAAAGAGGAWPAEIAKAMSFVMNDTTPTDDSAPQRIYGNPSDHCKLLNSWRVAEPDREMWCPKCRLGPCVWPAAALQPAAPATMAEIEGLAKAYRESVLKVQWALETEQAYSVFAPLDKAEDETFAALLAAIRAALARPREPVVADVQLVRKLRLVEWKHGATSRSLGKAALAERERLHSEREELAAALLHRLANPPAAADGLSVHHHPDNSEGFKAGFALGAASMKMARPKPRKGWKLVPEEPTEAMLSNTVDGKGTVRILDFTTPSERGMPFLMPRYIYRAMLAAAPSPPQSTPDRPADEVPHG